MRRKITNSVNLSMTETIRILRDNGFFISNANFPKLVDMGLLPFAQILRTPGSCKRTYWILRKDLLDWIQEQTVTEQRKEETV